MLCLVSTLMAFPSNKLVVFNKPTIPDAITLLQAIYYYDLTIGVTKGVHTQKRLISLSV